MCSKIPADQQFLKYSKQLSCINNHATFINYIHHIFSDKYPISQDSCPPEAQTFSTLVRLLMFFFTHDSMRYKNNEETTGNIPI